MRRSLLSSFSNASFISFASERSLCCFFSFAPSLDGSEGGMSGGGILEEVVRELALLAAELGEETAFLQFETVVLREELLFAAG